MTPEQVNHVQDSFAKIAPCGDTVAELFYGRLFSIAPEVRLLFPKDLSEQKKKLVQMLAVMVTKLHTFETIIPAVQNLGRRHRGYGVTPKHYAAVGTALLWTLEQGLGSAFTPQVKDAWTATYAAVADTMRGAAEEPGYAELSAKSGRSGAAIEQYEGRAESHSHQ